MTLLAAMLCVVSQPAFAARAPKTYKNCTALHKAYPHGVGLKGAKDKVRGRTKPVKTFFVDSRTYKLNTKLDRDKDRIACEKR